MILVRHGETRAQRRRHRAGMERQRALGARATSRCSALAAQRLSLRACGATALYSSPLGRALSTAQVDRRRDRARDRDAR